jgi:hypothetical protein
LNGDTTDDDDDDDDDGGEAEEGDDAGDIDPKGGISTDPRWTICS